jgi:outer membrane biosynthesis protein TonB
VKVDKTLVASAALHVLVLGWGLVSFSARSLEAPPEAMPVDIITTDQLAKITAGLKTGEKDKPKPLVEKVAEAKPVDDAVGKITEKQEVVTSTAPPPPPKTEEKPVEKKPDPPKPVAEDKPKEEAKPAEKKPEQPKVDPIAEALKKDEAKKPPPKAEAKATPPPPIKKREYKFNSETIAALVDKRDPSRQAVTGETLNSNAALGLAKGKAADNSATWGAMFKEQVLRCWKKPFGDAEAERVEAEFSIQLKKDGTLEAMPVARSTPGTPFQRVFQESGLRAIIDCAPYRLPPSFFDEWKFFDPVFDSRDL